MTDIDVIIVGSGINSLVCAAELTARKRRVLVLERAPVLSGCIRTEEATVPGYRHDLFAMSYPLLVSAPFYPKLKPRLEAYGLRMVDAAIPTGVLMPDGRSLLLRQSRGTNVATFDAEFPGDGQAYAQAMREVERDGDLIFGMLGQEARSVRSFGLLARKFLRPQGDSLAGFGASALLPARNWLEREFGSDLLRALIAPLVLHVGLGPESSLSGLMAKVILFTLEAAGIPFVEGGREYRFGVWPRDRGRRRCPDYRRGRLRSLYRTRRGSRCDLGGWPAVQRQARRGLQCDADAALRSAFEN